MLALLAGEGEAEPEPGLLDAAAAAQEARRREVVDALLGRNTTPPAEKPGGSLDGGARTTPQRVKTHGETLIEVLRSREADAGRDF